MARKAIHARRLAGAMFVSLTMAAAGAGTATGSPRFVTGGVSEGDRTMLHAQRASFDLWVISAAKKSGAYLADVQLRITDPQQRVVFDATPGGPWLLIDLPPGRYTVEGRRNGETLRRITTIHPGDRHQVFLYFNEAAEVLPPHDEPARTSPYTD